MSSDASSAPSLFRWRPALLTLTAVAAGLSIYYVRSTEQNRGGAEDDANGRGLRRSNAIRRRSPRLRHARASIAGDRASSSSAGQVSSSGGGTVVAAGWDGALAEEETDTRRGNSGDGNDDNDDGDDATSELDLWGNVTPGTAEGGQSLLNLLYHIAEEQAHREGYQHRGVTCNSCNMMPIKGIRYRCSNCPDYDLCEQCENLGVHDKTHLFYKIRIPAPFLGSNPRNQQPVWYPGKPYGLLRTVPKELKRKLAESTGFERSRIDALWEQFKSLAAVDWPQDPSGLCVAIDRKIWAKYCMPTMLREHEAPSALVFDQSFTFYDDNEDGLVGFEEFLGGLAAKQSKDQQEKLRRIFRAHDLDRDGYVGREDFMKLFTSNYSFMRELSRELFHFMYEEILDDRSLRDNLRNTQPVSSCFTGTIPPGEPSRTGEGKTMSSTGDWTVTDGGGFLRESDNGLVVSTAQQPQQQHQQQQQQQQQQQIQGVVANLFNDLAQPLENWPPGFVTPDDARVALDKNVPLNMITGVAEQQQVLDVAQRRMEKERREEENATPTEALNDGLAGDSESSSSMPTANGIVSQISGVHTPHSENEMELGRVGGAANSTLDSSFSQEFLYQATRDGFDEVLDPMFKQLEDLWTFYSRSSKERERLRGAIDTYRGQPENESLCRTWLTRLLRQWRKGDREGSSFYGDRMAEEILRKLIKERETASSEWATNLLDRIYSGFLSEEQLNSELERLATNQLDTSQALTRKIRHAWLTAKQGEAPNPEQLDEFLESLDEQMQGKQNDNVEVNEGLPSAPAEDIISIDERFIQDLLDGGEVLDAGQDILDTLTEDDLRLIQNFRNVDAPGANGVSDPGPASEQAPPGTNPEVHAHILPNGSIVQDTNSWNEQSTGNDNQNGQESSPLEVPVDVLNRAVSNLLSGFEFATQDDPMEVEPTVDPTLPQNRPNTVEEETPSLPAAPVDSVSNQARERSQKFVRWSQVNQEGTISSMEERDPFEDENSSYFQIKLKYLTLLELVAEEARERGGYARLNGQEFEQIMLGPKGRRLVTIGKWLDLAAF